MCNVTAPFVQCNAMKTLKMCRKFPCAGFVSFVCEYLHDRIKCEYLHDRIKCEYLHDRIKCEYLHDRIKYRLCFGLIFELLRAFFASEKQKKTLFADEEQKKTLFANEKQKKMLFADEEQKKDALCQ